MAYGTRVARYLQTFLATQDNSQMLSIQGASDRDAFM